jgi:predicted transposase/invertase (TIGR01784 family)
MALKDGGAVAEDKESGKIQQPHNVHDKGYRQLLGKKKMFLRRLRTFLAEEWVQDVAERDLLTVDKSFIPKSFRDKVADILYRVKKRDLDVIFFVLLELQSTVDFSMPIRLLSYMVEIWWKILDETPEAEVERKDFRLPAIVPMVLYNGPEPWTVKRNFKEIQSAYQQFGDHLLDFRYVLFDVHRYNDPELLEDANVVASVFFLDKRITWPEAVARLGQLADIIGQFPDNDFRWFTKWVNYSFIPRLPKAIQEKVSSILLNATPQEVEKMVSNLGLALEDALRDAKTEGERDGMLKGERQGMLKVARNMILRNMDVNAISDVTGLSLSEIEELKKQVQH